MFIRFHPMTPFHVFKSWIIAASLGSSKEFLLRSWNKLSKMKSSSSQPPEETSSAAPTYSCIPCGGDAYPAPLLLGL